jgi:hypothetical protein
MLYYSYLLSIGRSRAGYDALLTYLKHAEGIMYICNQNMIIPKIVSIRTGNRKKQVQQKFLSSILPMNCLPHTNESPGL